MYLPFLSLFPPEQEHVHCTLPDTTIVTATNNHCSNNDNNQLLLIIVIVIVVTTMPIEPICSTFTHQFHTNNLIILTSNFNIEILSLIFVEVCTAGDRKGKLVLIMFHVSLATETQTSPSL